MTHNVIEVPVEKTLIKKKLILFVFLIFLLSAFTSAIKWNFEIGGLFINLNLSHLICFLLIIYLLLSSLFTGHSIPVIYKDYPSVFLFLYFFSNLFASVFFSSNKTQSIKGSILIFTFWLMYLITRWTCAHLFSPGKAVRYLLKFNFLFAAFGLVAMIISFVLNQEIIGVSLSHLTGQGIENVPSIKSLTVEPNLFAIITASILCISIALYLVLRKNKRYLILIILITLAMVFAYTRSVYFAFLVSLSIMLYLSKRITANNFFIAAFSVFILFIFIQLQSADESSLLSILTTRTINIANFSEGTGFLRIQAFLIGLLGFMNSPFMGNGTLSADTEVLNPNTGTYYHLEGSPGWLGSVWIQSLHDTGVIGFMIILGLLISLIVVNYRLFMNKKISPYTRSILLGFLGGNIIIAISSQTSSVFWISFPFIFWGINMAFITEVKRKLKLEIAV